MADPFSPDGGFGCQLGKTLKLIAWGLHDWSSRNCEASMTAIPFDKLVEFTCRTWDSLRSGGETTFITPFKCTFGVHGPGRTLKRNNADPEKHPLIYAGEIVQVLNAPLRGGSRLFDIEGEPGHPDTKFKSGLTPPQVEFWETDQHFLTNAERGVFQTIRGLLAVLSEEEIRLLGTHADAACTVTALEKLHVRWTQRIHTALGPGPSGLEDREPLLLKALFDAREMVRKSDTNRDMYGHAWKKALKLVNGTKLDSPFRSVQKDPDAIWDDGRVKEWKRKTQVFFHFTKFARGAALRALQLGGKHLNKDERDGLEEVENSRKHLLDELPSGLFSVPRPLLPQDDGSHAGQGSSNQGLPTIERSAELVATQSGLEWFAGIHEAIRKHFQ